MSILSLGHRATAENPKLPTKKVRICKVCGAGHFEDVSSLCHACGVAFDQPEEIETLYRIENVATHPAERITANDEERQRQGFELQTTFEWAVRDHLIDVRSGHAMDGGDVVARLSYGPGARITRLNKGLRRRADRTQLGFNIDPVSGYWAKNDDDGDDVADPTAIPKQWIVPSVQDHKNALLFQPVGDELEQSTLATVQHAMLRGIETVFQLEQGEILAEPMPSRDTRSGFLLYEATEGGAGVLTRLVAEPTTIATVARQALRIMHFVIDAAGPPPTDAADLSDSPGTSCVAACYKCLMSYYNQPDHEIIDRRDPEALELLLRLARSTTTGLGNDAKAKAPAASSAASSTASLTGDPSLARWLALAAERGLPAPDASPLSIGGPQLSLVWRDHYVAAMVSGAFDDELRSRLDAQGIELFIFEGAESGWSEAFRKLAVALGHTA